MYKRYQQGATLNEIGEQYGLGQSRVSRLFKAAGLKMRSRAENAELNREPAALIQEMHELYEQGATLSEVGKEFGTNAKRVRQLFNAAGLWTRSRTVRYPIDVVNEMYELYQQGATLEQIGNEYGISSSHLSGLFKRAGLQTRYKPADHPIHEMYELYQGGDTLAQISQRFRISAARVGELFRAAGLEIRSKAVDYPVNEIYELYEQGASLKQVGSKFGLSSSRVSELFKAADIQTRPRAAQQPVHELYQLYQLGATMAEVGEEFGIGARRVSELFKTAGLKTRTRTTLERPVDDMYAMYEHGATMEAVAQEFSLSINRTRKLFIDAGLRIRSRSEHEALKRAADPRVPKMYELYEQGATLKQVGKEFGVTSVTVSNRFKAAGLSTRHTKDSKHPVEEMYGLYREGASLMAIGNEHGLSGTRVGELFKAAGLKTRPPATEHPVEEIYELYEQGASLKQLGSKFGLSSSRVGQLFNAAGLKTRSAAQAHELRHQAFEVYIEDHREEIIEAFRQVKDAQLVAQKLDISKHAVARVLREDMPTDEYRAFSHKPAKRKYSDQELIGFLRKASTTLGGTLTGARYESFARTRRTPDGRPWPTRQTYSLRFESWRAALLTAGLDANPPSAAAGKRSFDTAQCVDAVRIVERALGKVPAVEDYEKYARQSKGALPSTATVRNRCGTWSQALRMAGL